MLLNCYCLCEKTILSLLHMWILNLFLSFLQYMKVRYYLSSNCRTEAGFFGSIKFVKGHNCPPSYYRTKEVLHIVH